MTGLSSPRLSFLFSLCSQGSPHAGDMADRCFVVPSLHALPRKKKIHQKFSDWVTCLHRDVISVTTKCTGVGVLEMTVPQEADGIWEEPFPKERGEGLGDSAARKWQKACGIDQKENRCLMQKLLQSSREAKHSL